LVLIIFSSPLPRSNCDEEIGAVLREHYQKPYFLPATAETKKTDWIFMGSRGYGAPMHVSHDSRRKLHGDSSAE